MSGAATATRTPDFQLMRQNASENIKHLSRIADEATREGITLSAKLERLDPSTQYENTVGLDSFDRCLLARGIRVNSDLSAGIYANRLESFMEHKGDENGAALAGEWINRVWRTAKYNGRRRLYGVESDQQRITFGSDDLPVGSAYRPYVDAAGLRARQIAPSIPISELVGATSTIDNNVYRSVYLSEPSTDSLRLKRVAEGADIPKTKIGTRQQAIYLYKYGRAIESTYEALRRVPLDTVALLISRIAVQADEDKVGTIVDIIVNGDGNASTSATNVNLTTLDSATTANNYTLPAHLALLFEFTGPYALTTILANQGPLLKVLLVNAGTANKSMVEAGIPGLGGFRMINPEFDGDIAVGRTTWAPSNKLIAFDKRYAVERVIEAGAAISESMRWIINQTEILTITEVEGYGIMDANATRSINLAA